MRNLLLALSVAATIMVGPVVNTQGCEEDQPCWDCHTMGNKVCGPDQSVGGE